VKSISSDVDPVGACVGMKGSRVQAVVQELRGEKIDIIPWTIDIAKNVCNSLAPAEVSRMIIDDEQLLVMVIVGDDQLSLAIGRKGQNVRLASQLTGWNIDIKGESEMDNLTKEAQTTLGRIPGIGPVLAEKLYIEGFTSAFDLSRADDEILAVIPGIGKVKAARIIDDAGAFFQDQLEDGEVDVRGKSLKPVEEAPKEAVEPEEVKAEEKGESKETAEPDQAETPVEEKGGESEETAESDQAETPAEENGESEETAPAEEDEPAGQEKDGQ